MNESQKALKQIIELFQDISDRLDGAESVLVEVARHCQSTRPPIRLRNEQAFMDMALAAYNREYSQTSGPDTDM